MILREYPLSFKKKGHNARVAAASVVVEHESEDGQGGPEPSEDKKGKDTAPRVPRGCLDTDWHRECGGDRDELVPSHGRQESPKV